MRADDERAHMKNPTKNDTAALYNSTTTEDPAARALRRLTEVPYLDRATIWTGYGIG